MSLPKQSIVLLVLYWTHGADSDDIWALIHEHPLPLAYGRAACALPLGAYGHFNMGTPRMPNVTPAARILPAPYFDKDAKRLRIL